VVITVNFDSDQPIYEQLRNQIVIGIGTGELASGDKLPTVRQLADDLGVNAMTVNKAYMLLKNEGYIIIDRRHGAKIRPHLNGEGNYRAELEEDLKLVISEASIRGMNQDEFLAICKKLFGTIAFNRDSSALQE